MYKSIQILAKGGALNLIKNSQPKCFRKSTVLRRKAGGFLRFGLTTLLAGLMFTSIRAQPKARDLDGKVQTLFDQLLVTVRLMRHPASNEDMGDTTFRRIDSISTAFFAYGKSGSFPPDSELVAAERRNVVTFLDVMGEQDTSDHFVVRPIDSKTDSMTYALLDPYTSKLTYAVIKNGQNRLPFCYLLIVPHLLIHTNLPRILSYKMIYTFGHLYFIDLGNSEGTEYFLGRKYAEIKK